MQRASGTTKPGIGSSGGEGSSTGAARRLPVRGSAEGEIDGLNRSGRLDGERAVERGDGSAAQVDECRSLYAGLETLKNVCPTTPGETRNFIALCGSVAETAQKQADSLTSPNLGKVERDLAEGLLQMADEARSMADEARPAVEVHALQNPSTVRNVLVSKSYTTDGAIKILERHRGEALTTTSRSLVDSAIAFLTTRRDRLQNSSDETALDKKGAQAVMGSEKGDEGLGEVDKTVRSAVEAKLAGIDRQTGCGGLELPDSMPGIREDGIMTLFLEKVIQEAGITGPKDIESSLLEGRLDSLNNGQIWATIDKKVAFKQDGKTEVVDSQIKPQSQLGNIFDKMEGHGINCHMSKSYEHVTNLAVTSATIKGETVFEGIRHGTLAAYKIKVSELTAMSDGELKKMIGDLKPEISDVAGAIRTLRSTNLVGRPSGAAGRLAKELRQEACKRRALDVATAALVKNGDKLAAALANPGVPVKLSISSMSLLTPSAIAGEKGMWRDQASAWAAVGKGVQTLKVRDASGQEVDVDVVIDVRAFNFGVNQMALGGRDTSLGGIAGLKGRLKAATGISGINYLSGNWDGVAKQNAASMEKLLGSRDQRTAGEFRGAVGLWLSDNVGHPDEQIVKELATQVSKLFDDPSQPYQRAGTEPHKLVSRLAVLTHKIGDDAAWNCKSGKDRTGQLDVEAKFLATEIKMTGKVPNFERVRSAEDRENLFNMAVGGGNHELQFLNTGAPGFKLGNFPVLSNLYGLGSKGQAWAQVTGLSAHFGS